MATLYNKTALNKMKKAELVELFLQQQVEKNQLVLDAEEHEKIKSHMTYMGHDKMKKELKEMKKELKVRAFEIIELRNENRKLKEELIKEKEENVELMEENKGLKEENKQLTGMFNVVVISEGEKVDKIEELKQKLQKIKYLYDQGFLDDQWEMDDDFTITLIADEDEDD